MKQILRIFVVVSIFLTVPFSSWAGSNSLIKYVARDSMSILKSLAVFDPAFPKLINHTVQEHAFFPGLVAFTMGREHLFTANDKVPFTELSISSSNIGGRFVGLDLGFTFEFVLTNGNGELKISDLREYVRNGIASVVIGGENLESSVDIVPAAYLVVLNALLKVPGWMIAHVEKPEEDLLEAFVVYTKLVDVSLNPDDYGEDVRNTVKYAQREIGERVEEDAMILDTKISYPDRVKSMIESLLQPLFKIYNSMDREARTENERLFKQGVLAVLGILENSNLILRNEAAVIEDQPLKWLDHSAGARNVTSIISEPLVKHMKF